MPHDDNEATEMVEAYGQRLETAPPPAHDGLSIIQFADFLLKFIVIGWKMYLRIYCIYRLFFFQEKRALANPACYTISYRTPVRK